MLSLNSDSSQKHYLGSSSGLLFTSLIATSPSTDVSTTDASPDVPHLARDQWHDGGAADHLVREHYQSLHNTLRQVRTPST